MRGNFVTEVCRLREVVPSLVIKADDPPPKAEGCSALLTLGVSSRGATHSAGATVSCTLGSITRGRSRVSSLNILLLLTRP
jgi:hypothetical protein